MLVADHILKALLDKTTEAGIDDVTKAVVDPCDED
jgi:hypothetical protein